MRIKGYFWAKYAMVMFVIAIGGGAVFFQGSGLLDLAGLITPFTLVFITGESWNYTKKKAAETERRTSVLDSRAFSRMEPSIGDMSEMPVPGRTKKND